MRDETASMSADAPGRGRSRVTGGSDRARRARTAFAWLTAAFLAACVTGPPPPPEAEWPELPAGASDLGFERIEEAHTAMSGFDQARHAVIRSADQWAAWWEELHGRRSPPGEPPAVDFDREVVIGAAMGQRGTGGFEVSVEGVYQADGRLVVRVLETSPGPECAVTQAVTSPATAVRVPGPAEEVSFVELERTIRCD